MHIERYFDWGRGRALTMADGCAYDRWRTTSGEHAFAVHDDGFPVFLSPAQMGDADEYRGGDPYRVEQNLNEAFQRRRFESTTELLALVVRERGERLRVLDVGCGEGHLTAALHERFPHAEISGLDYSLSAIRYAHQHFPGIEFIVADACELPYSPGYFEAVVCNNVWEHVPDPLHLLRAVARVTRPSGYLIISTPSRYHIGNLARALLGRPIRLMNTMHVTEYTVGQVQEQLRAGGYDVDAMRSRSIELGSLRFEQVLVHRVLKPVLRIALRLVGSHHSLESTVFYLAHRRG